MIELPKNLESIGLISFLQYIKVLVARLVLWACKKGAHPVKMLLQEHIREMFEKNWGTKIFTWVYLPYAILPRNRSKVLTCKPMHLLERVTKAPTTKTPIQSGGHKGPLPLTLGLAHIQPKKVACKFQSQRKLCDIGLQTLGFVFIEDNRGKTWEEYVVPTSPRKRT